MSNTGKYTDRTPGIRQSGLTSALANESSAVSVQQRALQTAAALCPRCSLMRRPFRRPVPSISRALCADQRG